MRTKTVDGKKVIYKSSSKNTPPLSVIKQVYAKIPDNKRIPVVFETKEQYLDEYIKNQEKAKKTKFTPTQIQQYKHTELQGMKNIVSRYTTKQNPYIDLRTVFFTDKKIPPKQFAQSAYHEYGHELWEKSPKIRKDWKTVNRTTSPTTYGRTDRQEDFAESFMLAKSGIPIDNKRQNILQRDVGLNRNIHPSVRKIARMGGGLPEDEETYKEGMRELGLDKFLPKEEIETDKEKKDKWIPDKLMSGMRYKYKMIPTTQILPGETEEQGFYKSESKIASIRDSGPILKPVVVSNKVARTGEWSNEGTRQPPADKYPLIDGHHRFSAATQRGDTTIPAQILDIPKQTMQWRQRKGLTPIPDNSSKQDIGGELIGLYTPDVLTTDNEMIKGLPKYFDTSTLGSRDVGLNIKGLLRKKPLPDMSRNMVWAKGIDAEDIPLAKGTFGEPDEPAYTKKRVIMPPATFLKRQYDQRPNAKTSTMPFEQWADVGEYGRKRIEDMKKALLDPKAEVPVPIEEYDVYGKRRDFQEGRHRGLAAQELGMDVPVILARKRTPPWDRTNKDDPYTSKRFYGAEKIPKDTEWDTAVNEFAKDPGQDRRFDSPVKPRYPGREGFQIKWYPTEEVLKKHQTADPDNDITNPHNQIGNRLPNAKEFISQKKFMTEESTSGRIGFEPPLVNQKGSISDGRHRLLALKELGYTEIPVEEFTDTRDEVEKDNGKNMAINLINSRKFKFGTIAWQDAMENNINEKMKHGEEFGPGEKAYIDTQRMIHPKEDIELTWKLHKKGDEDV